MATVMTSVLVIFVSISLWSCNCETVGEFFDNIEIKISSAWNDLVSAIKRPVRIRRLGSVGSKYELKTSSTSTPELASPYLPFDITTESVKEINTINQDQEVSQKTFIYTTNFPIRKVVTPTGKKIHSVLRIPLIGTPIWKRYMDWRRHPVFLPKSNLKENVIEEFKTSFMSTTELASAPFDTKTPKERKNKEGYKKVFQTNFINREVVTLKTKNLHSVLKLPMIGTPIWKQYVDWRTRPDFFLKRTHAH